jgi:imidazolonepropionase-like amidohydrolase
MSPRTRARVPAALLLLLVAAPPAPVSALGDPSAWKNTRPEQPAAVLIRNATIWTSAPQGMLEGADLLVRQGKVAAVGRGLAAPPGALVVDAAGKHVTAGLIDAHSHSAIVGNVNEATNITTAEVRIADVVNAESIHIYRQLAGGLTIANLLHGSANSIGGQNAIIKLRWGAPPEELLMAGAPPGIKFALGENPKQANWNVRQRRYPQTRMGVEQSIRQRFLAALDYRREWQEWQARGRAAQSDAVPPRRDLELETILEILDGKRLVHAHSYRHDEILMLLRVAEEFGFRVASLQHILEGYKVADEIARHGAAASGFSDWWAYKYEVIDAIPYNGAIEHARGVVVSFNSDDSELARRLNLEAAKAVRYGGVPEVEALDFVTRNAAITLGIQDRVGSLEPGKDADFVVWSGHPLSTYSRCEQTWIDGRKYFDRQEDLLRREEVAAERAALLAKVKETKKDDGKGEKGKGEGETPPAATAAQVSTSYRLWEDNADTACVTHAGREERR